MRPQVCSIWKDRLLLPGLIGSMSLLTRLHNPQFRALSTVGPRLASHQLHVSFLTSQIMPPKKKTNAVKRKAASESQSDNETTQSASKKTKVSRDSLEPAVATNGQPTNKVLPVNISFPPRIAGTVRLSTWNICSLASASKKVRNGLIVC
jgi:AP endonuclease-1